VAGRTEFLRQPATAFELLVVRLHFRARLLGRDDPAGTQIEVGGD
jgi:hypothetical protein